MSLKLIKVNIPKVKEDDRSLQEKIGEERWKALEKISMLITALGNRSSRDETEFANLFCSLSSSKYLVYSSDLKEVYLADKEKILYRKISEKEATSYVGEKLREWVNIYAKYFCEKEDDNPVVIQILESYVEKCQNLFRQFGNLSFQKSIREIASSKLINQTLINRLDRSKNLLPLLNCKVWDFETSTERKRKLSDAFTFECPIDLELVTSEIHEEVKDFLLKICCQDEERLSWLCTCLEKSMNGQCYQKFVIAIGEGSNGKSSLGLFMREMLTTNFSRIAKRNRI